MRMVVYVDAVFALNALLDYLLLRGSARLGGAPIRQGRLLSAAAAGGLYAACCAVPQWALLRSFWARLLAFCVMILLAFGWQRRSLWQGALTLGLSFALCGVLTALALVLGARLRLLGGVACYALDAPSLVLAAGTAYALTAACFSGLGGHSGGDVTEVTAQLSGQTVRFAALRDTGNTLRDPLTGRAVLVAEWELARELLPPSAARLVTPQTLEHPDTLLARCAAAEPTLRLRLIPYRAVGVRSALLLAVCCDAVTIDGKQEKGGLIAFSPTAVSENGGYRALAGGI
jgi:stage II sporulation protein GA (sporulation sigma-E factor processing peptidase)